MHFKIQTSECYDVMRDNIMICTDVGLVSERFIFVIANKLNLPFL